MQTWSILNSKWNSNKPTHSVLGERQLVDRRRLSQNPIDDLTGLDWADIELDITSTSSWRNWQASTDWSGLGQNLLPLLDSSSYLPAEYRTSELWLIWTRVTDLSLDRTSSWPYKILSSLDGLIWTELPPHNRKESPIGLNLASRWSIGLQNRPLSLFLSLYPRFYFAFGVEWISETEGRHGYL